MGIATDSIESLAIAIHETAREAHRYMKLNYPMVPLGMIRHWDDLPDDYKDGRRYQARLLFERINR